MATIEVDDGGVAEEGVSSAQLAEENRAADAALIERLAGKAQAAAPAAEEASEPTAEGGASELPTGDDGDAATETAGLDDTIEIAGRALPKQRVLEAVEALGEFDAAYQGLLDKRAAINQQAQILNQQREQLNLERQQIQQTMGAAQQKSAAWDRILPLLESENWQALEQMVKTAKAGGGMSRAPGAHATADIDALVEQKVTKRLQSERQSLVMDQIDRIGSLMISSNPEFKQVFGGDSSDTLMQLRQRLVAEVNAGNVDLNSPELELRQVIKRTLQNMRAKEVAKAERIMGLAASKTAKATSGLPPVSKTSGSRAPSKPGSLKVDYGGASDQEFDAHIQKMLAGYQNMTKE